VTRLRDFNGGQVPPNVAREIEFRRKQLGLQQWFLCQYIGFKQPTYSNATAGRFRCPSSQHGGCARRSKTRNGGF